MTERDITDAAAAAEEVGDPIAEMFGRLDADPGAPFAPEALAALAELRAADRPAYEAVRSRLKRAGVRVAALDGAVDGGRGGGGRGADRLLAIAGEVEVFCALDGTGYADIKVDSHRETWPIASRRLERWLVGQYYRATGGAPSGEALQGAIRVLAARADVEGAERPVHLRVAPVGDRIYLDLVDASWRAVEIDASGWRLVEAPAAVRFRRSPGMLALPEPVRGGSIDMLRGLINCAADDDFVLVVSWLLAAMRGSPPYPILVVMGEHGSAKSSFCGTIRSLIDPAVASLRALPVQERDFYVAAHNSYALAFDNLSHIPPAMSDSLCQMASGGGFATRAMYTDLDETIIALGRPLIINGISRVLRRPDLGERSLLLTLAPIMPSAAADRAPRSSPRSRRAGRRYWAPCSTPVSRACAGCPASASTRRLASPTMPAGRRPARPRSGRPARSRRRSGAIAPPCSARLADEDAVVDAVLRMMIGRETWRGTATELLAALEAEVGEAERRSKTWPGAPSVLGRRLRAVAKTLRGVRREGGNRGRQRSRRTRTVTLSSFFPKIFFPREETSLPSVPSAPDPKPLTNNDTSSDGMRTAADGTDAAVSPDEEIEL